MFKPMHFCLKKLSNDDREIITYKQQDISYKRIASMLKCQLGIEGQNVELKSL